MLKQENNLKRLKRTIKNAHKSIHHITSQKLFLHKDKTTHSFTMYVSHNLNMAIKSLHLCEHYYCIHSSIKKSYNLCNTYLDFSVIMSAGIRLNSNQVTF